MSSMFAQGSERLAESSQGAAFARTAYFKVEDGKEEIIRLLTDFQVNAATPHLGGWITVLQHQGVRTRPRPGWIKDDAKWPERWGCVCRNTKAEGVPGEPPLWTLMDDKEHEGCWLDINGTADAKKASGRGWALACLREEVREDGQLRGYKDKTREVERDGVTVTEKAIVVINLGYKNFFSTLEGFAHHYGTAVDRDYLVRRKGTGTNTTYPIVPLDPIPGFDLRDPEIFSKYAEDAPNLDEIITDQAKWDYQRRWFDPEFTPPKKDDSDSSSSSSSSTQQAAPAEQQEQRPAGDVDPAAMAAMAARVGGTYGAPAADAPAAAAQDTAPAGAAPAAAGGGLQNIE